MTMGPEFQPVDYPYYEETVTESTWHAQVIHYLSGAFEHRYESRKDVFVGSNNFIYWEEHNKDEKLAPDVYICFGAKKRGRTSYKLWEEAGVVPQVVFEITSRSSRFIDLGNKKAVYEMLGVEEYYLFDPLREYLPQGLRAFRRKNDGFDEIKLPASADASAASPKRSLRVFSPRLDLDLVAEGELLRLYEPGSKVRLKTYVEAETARRKETRARKLAEEACQREIEARIAAETALGEAEEAQATLARENEELRRRLGL